MRRSLGGSFKKLVVATGLLTANEELFTEDFVRIEKVDSSQVSVAGAVVGGVLLGPVGAAIGASAGSVTYVVHLRDGRQFLATSGTEDYQTLLGLTFRPASPFRARRNECPHSFHMIVTLCTCGLWAPFWFLHALYCELF